MLPPEDRKSDQGFGYANHRTDYLDSTEGSTEVEENTEEEGRRLL